MLSFLSSFNECGICRSSLLFLLFAKHPNGLIFLINTLRALFIHLFSCTSDRMLVPVSSVTAVHTGRASAELAGDLWAQFF